MSPLPTVAPSLVHVIFGTGLPVALQWNAILSPSLMVWSTGLNANLGGTAKGGEYLVSYF